MNAPTIIRTRIVGIQYLRGLAAMAVALFHTSVNMPALAWPSVLDREFGDAGVDVFFVISGFVMFYVSQDAALSPKAFLLRRMIRIVPAYWAMNILAVAAAFFFAIGKANEIELFHVARSMLFIPHVNPASGNNVPLLKPGYTLNYEVYFYFVVSLSLLVRGHRRRLALLCSYALAATLLFIVTDPQAPVLRIYENPIILEFVAGACLGCLFIEGRLARLDPRVGVVMLALGCIGLPLFHVKNSEFQALWHGVPATLIVCGALVVEATGRLPRSRALKWLGDCSYSFYLVNAVFLSAFARAVAKLSLPIDDLFVGTALTIIGLIGAAGAGYVVYLVIERPAIDRLNRLFFGRGAAVEAPVDWTRASAERVNM